MASVDWFLIIICIVFSVLSLWVGFYVVVRFQHPEDKHQSWGTKIIIMLALGVSTMNVLLLPLDSLNRSTGNTLKLDIMCWVFLIASLILVFVVIPFVMTYYERTEDEEDPEKHPIIKSIFITLGWIIFFVIIFLILYFTVGRCEIPIEINYCEISSAVLPPLNDPPADFNECKSCRAAKTTWSITPSPVVYIIAMIGFFGYLFLLIFGGIGFITLPFNLFSTFVNRPKPIKTSTWSKATDSLNKWANDLLEEGKLLEETVHTYGRNHKKCRKGLIRFEQQVESLENAYETVEIMYRVHGGNPLWPWCALALGIITIIISILWVVHIIFYYYLDLNPILNSFFDILDRAFPYAALIFFGIFVYYLYWAVLSGVSSVGVNLLVVRLHAMEVGRTPMTSILFNCGIMIFASFGVAMFSTMNFPIYTRLTSLDMIYGVQMQTLQGLKYVWKWGIIAMLVFFCIALIWKLITCKKKDRRMKILIDAMSEYNMKGINK